MTLSISGGDRLLLTGPNGSGKSTLIGEIAAGNGAVGEHVRIGVLTQHEPQWDNPDLVAAEVYDRHVLALGESNGVSAPGLSSLGLLDREARSTPVSRMSQGQQRRLHLALVLAGRPDLLVLDEPTNHLSAPLVDAMTEAFERPRRRRWWWPPTTGKCCGTSVRKPAGHDWSWDRHDRRFRPHDADRRE